MTHKTNNRDHSYTDAEHELKEGIDLDFDFPKILVRVVAKDKEEAALFSTYRLASLDENKQNKLVTRIELALISPQETGSYELAIISGRDEESAIKYAEFEGLILMGMLGKRRILPELLEQLREKENSDSRTRIIAGAVLRNLTGQDIGDYILSNRDIALWEEWWEQNKLT